MKPLKLVGSDKTNLQNWLDGYRHGRRDALDEHFYEYKPEHLKGEYAKGYKFGQESMKRAKTV